MVTVTHLPPGCTKKQAEGIIALVEALAVKFEAQGKKRTAQKVRNAVDRLKLDAAELK